MSASSYRTLSHEAASSENGVSPPAGQPITGQSPELEEARHDTSKATEAKADAFPIRGPKAKAENESRPGSRKRPRQASGQKGGLNRAINGYRDVLNQEIDDAAGRSQSPYEPLPPSQVGASFWTSDEKEAFFRKLTVCEKGDLHALCTAVGTKSKAECHVYLRLLQEGAFEADVTLPAKDGFSLGAMPAAADIRGECEEALNETANVLSYRVEERDEEVERERYGDLWLIDQELASTLELQVEEDESRLGGDDDDAQRDGGNDPEAIPCPSPRPISNHDRPLLDMPALWLLQPAIFLQLSGKLFMNGPPDTESNWQDIVSVDDNHLGPAIYRTAFDDLYNLTVSLTRRLVQASIFQATSRLRASDGARADWQPKAEVREIDVRTAMNILSINADRRIYWATAARRCGVEVYSDSKKYRDGRDGTKNGVKLTYDEVEKELGLQIQINQDEPAVDSDHMGGDGEVEMGGELEFDSDAFTIESHSGNPSSASEIVSDDDEERDSERARKKRKRARSPRSHECAENAYLEALDRKAGLSEERHLWEVLGQTPPATDDQDILETQTAPKKPNETAVAQNWRPGLVREAEWEHFPERVKQSEFDAMGRKGVQRRLRRSAMQEETCEKMQGAEGGTRSASEQDYPIDAAGGSAGPDDFDLSIDEFDDPDSTDDEIG